jgi:hypothetical protein
MIRRGERYGEVVVNLDFGQVQKIVDQLGPDGQKRLTEYFEKNLSERLKAFSLKAKDFPLSDRRFKMK